MLNQAGKSLSKRLIFAKTKIFGFQIATADACKVGLVPARIVDVAANKNIQFSMNSVFNFNAT